MTDTSPPCVSGIRKNFSFSGSAPWPSMMCISLTPPIDGNITIVRAPLNPLFRLRNNRRFGREKELYPRANRFNLLLTLGHAPSYLLDGILKRYVAI